MLGINIIAVGNLLDSHRAAIKAGMEAASAHHASAMSSLIRQGCGFDGSASPPNSPATRRIKAKRGQPPIPGFATGELSTAGRWRTEQSATGISVYPPGSRTQVVDRLERKRFKLTGAPEQSLKAGAAAFVETFTKLMR